MINDAQYLLKSFKHVQPSNSANSYLAALQFLEDPCDYIDKLCQCLHRAKNSTDIWCHSEVKVSFASQIPKIKVSKGCISPPGHVLWPTSGHSPVGFVEGEIKRFIDSNTVQREDWKDKHAYTKLSWPLGIK